MKVFSEIQMMRKKLLCEPQQQKGNPIMSLHADTVKPFCLEGRGRERR
jgi:hypothetical protein